MHLAEQSARSSAGRELLGVVLHRILGEHRDRGVRGVAHGRQRKKQPAADLLDSHGAEQSLGTHRKLEIEPFRRGLEPLGDLGTDQALGSARCALDGGGGELIGDSSGGPVDELVALVDDDCIVLGEHRNVVESVDGQHRVVGDHDLGRDRCRPRLLGKTIVAVGALGGTDAFATRDRDAAPDATVDRLVEIVAVAGLGLVGPRAQPLGLAPEHCRRSGEQCDVVVLRLVDASMQAVETEVVVSPLEHRVGRAPPEDGLERVDEAR